MKMHFIFSALVFAGLVVGAGQAQALVELCDMSSEASVLACVKAKTTEINEANLPNEYFVETAKVAREDLRVLLAPFEKRTDAYAREVVASASDLAKATHVGFVAQYEDEPHLHYFSISANGVFTMLFDLNSIDLRGDYPSVKDLATFVLHAKDLSQPLRETLEYAYKDENGLAVACDISDERGVAKYYSEVLNAGQSSPNVKAIAAGKISKDVLRCTDMVDIAFELGDGYYDVKWSSWLAVYGPDKKTIEGYLARYGVTYTEANDPSQVDEVIVRFNRLGQRISKVGDY